ncbi:TPA: AAA family ATPase [Photobacterium damselae]
MKISKINVKNFKKIRNLDLDIPADNRVLCFVGENGANKSSLLSALYANLRQTSNVTSPSDEQGRYIDNLNHVSTSVSPDERFSLLSLSLSEDETVIKSDRAIVPSPEHLSEENKQLLRTTFNRFYDEEKKFLLGISNFRNVNSYHPDLVRQNVVLFRPFNRTETPTWEKEYQSDNHDVVATGDNIVGKRKFPMRVASGIEKTNSYFLDVLLDHLIDVTNNRASPHSLFKHFREILSTIEPAANGTFTVHDFPDKRISFPNVPELASLSAGQSDWFVTAINTLIQMKELASNTAPELIRNVGGIVFIDEMDMNYHPSFQERVLPWFLDFFPNIQFIITTHSPYLIRSLGKNSLVVKLPTGEVLDDDFSYYDINEVALKVFGQDQGFSPIVQNKLVELKRALSKSNNADARAIYDQLITKSESLDRELNKIVITVADEGFIGGLQ